MQLTDDFRHHQGLMAHIPRKYGMVGLIIQIPPCGSIGAEKFETILFIFMFMMWSIKHATCWAVPISMALIMSIK